MGGGITSWTKVVPTLLKAGFGPLEVLRFLMALGAQLPSRTALLLLRKMLDPLDEMYGAAPFLGILLTTKCEPKEVFDPVCNLFRITVRPTLKMAKEALNGLAFKAKLFNEALAFVSFFVEEIGGDKTLPEEFFFLCLERPIRLDHVVNSDKLNVWGREETRPIFLSKQESGGQHY